VKQPLSRDGFRALTGIDAATTERLAAYLKLLCRWQRRINLVGASTLADPWRRHMLDSAQLAPLLPPGQPPNQPNVVDLGSGAGFPGLVLAMVSAADVRLVDSDARKCAFLREAARITGTRVQVDNRRMDALPAGVADVVVARACAPLDALLPVAAHILRPGGRCLFLKGRSLDAELTVAEKAWTLSAIRIGSVSDPAGAILTVSTLQSRHDR
jgi:16S rRNA (guanine(527)-N(7))-methyltransferase RsmG